jgi:hypothetical protein
MLLNQTPFLDSGFLLCKESSDLLSSMAVLHYEFYENYNDVKTKIQAQSEQIQCVIMQPSLDKSAIRFGNAQIPSWTDYADNIDTMDFLMQLQ